MIGDGMRIVGRHPSILGGVASFFLGDGSHVLAESRIFTESRVLSEPSLLLSRRFGDALWRFGLRLDFDSDLLRFRVELDLKSDYR